MNKAQKGLTKQKISTCQEVILDKIIAKNKRDKEVLNNLRIYRKLNSVLNSVSKNNLLRIKQT